MTTYILAVIFLIITPGPGVLTTAGVGSGYGFRAGLPYLFGIVWGSLIVLTSVATGLAALVFSIPFIRSILLFASLGYLIYLAFRIASSGSTIAFINTDKPLGFLNGVTLSVINPKAYAVATTLFSGFPILPDSPVAEAIVKIVVFGSISVPMHFLWLFAGATLKNLGLGSKATRAINIAMAIAMLAVVGLAVYSSEF